LRATGSVLKGTVVLGAAAFCVKLIGAGYRIYLARLIGTEGIGLYQMAYPVYLIFLSMSTAGIPIAISKIIAEKVSLGRYSGIKSTFKAAWLLLFSLGLIFTAGMVIVAPWFSTCILADYRAVYGIWALAPGIFFMSLTAVYRGYFQGWMDMMPCAVSQILEQIVRVAVALVLAILMLHQGVEHAAAGAAFGATAGGAAALGYLMVLHHIRKPLFPADHGTKIRQSLVFDIKALARFALPISLAVILTPLLQSMDSVIVPKQLQGIGYSMGESTSMLGFLGNCWAVVYLPLIITTAISTNLVPAIAAAQTGRKWSELRIKIEEGFRLTLSYLTPVLILVLLFGPEIYQILYGNKQITLLSWFAPAIFFLGMEQVSAGMLQGLGKPKWPLLNFAAGSIIKVTVTLIATGWPGFNLAGAALGTIGGAGITALLNLRVIRRSAVLNWKPVVPVLLSGAGMGWLGYFLKGRLVLPVIPELVVVGLMSALGYLAILWFLGGIRITDLEVIARLMMKKGNCNG
jgi:stage V sporulation protein B